MILLNTDRFKQGQRGSVKSSSQSMFNNFLCFMLIKYLIPICVVDEERRAFKTALCKVQRRKLAWHENLPAL